MEVAGNWAFFLSYIFSFYTILLLGLVIYNVTRVYLQINNINGLGDVFSTAEDSLVFIITCINVASYFVIALIHLPSHCKFVFNLLFGCISSLVYQGADSHVMLIYAFCNVDNVSWGTKGNNGKRIQSYLI